MSSSDFQRALARVLVYEGGKVDDPRDPGGRTNKGITQDTYDAFLREENKSARDVYAISDAEVATIYKDKYWDLVKGDQLPSGLDLCVFDATVNSGVGRAGKWLQQSLGEHYVGHIDGLIGTKTLQSIEDFGDNEQLIINFCSHRLATLQKLKTYKTFGKGWHARIANCQKIATSWCAAEPVAPPSVDLAGLQGNAKADVGPNIDQPTVVPIVTHVVTGAGSIGTVATQTASQITAIGSSWRWLTYACVGLTLVGIVAGIVVKFGSDAAKSAADGAATATVDPDADAGLPTVSIVDPKRVNDLLQNASPAAIAAATDPAKKV